MKNINWHPIRQFKRKIKSDNRIISTSIQIHMKTVYTIHIQSISSFSISLYKFHILVLVSNISLDCSINAHSFTILDDTVSFLMHITHLNKNKSIWSLQFLEYTEYICFSLTISECITQHFSIISRFINLQFTQVENI